MFFDGWQGPIRIVVVGVLAYAALVLILRSSGKRTLTKLNAFDLVITVALGSTLATILLSKQTPLVNGLVALGLLVLLQYAVTWLSMRSQTVRALVRSEPRLLLHHGRFLEGAMREERVNQEEILQALRSAGVSEPGNAQAVVLETDGSLSVLTGAQASPGTLANVKGATRQPPA